MKKKRKTHNSIHRENTEQGGMTSVALYFLCTEVNNRSLKIFYRDIRFARESLASPTEGGILFGMGLLPEGRHDVAGEQGLDWRICDNGVYEIGWCGQNGTLAVAGLVAVPVSLSQNGVHRRSQKQLAVGRD